MLDTKISQSLRYSCSCDESWVGFLQLLFTYIMRSTELKSYILPLTCCANSLSKLFWCSCPVLYVISGISRSIDWLFQWSCTYTYISSPHQTTSSDIAQSSQYSDFTVLCMKTWRPTWLMPALWYLHPELLNYCFTWVYLVFFASRGQELLWCWLYTLVLPASEVTWEECH